MKCLNVDQSRHGICHCRPYPVLGNRAEAQSPSESSASKIVTGEVAQVEGEFHMATDPLGELTLDIVDKSYVITVKRVKRCASNSTTKQKSLKG